MKKIKFTVVFYLIFLGISCICPSQGTTTFITIETASALLYSFDENGIFPYLDEFNREELGITVGMDSVSQNIISQVNFGFIEFCISASDHLMLTYIRNNNSITFGFVIDLLYHLSHSYPILYRM